MSEFQIHFISSYVISKVNVMDFMSVFEIYNQITFPNQIHS